MDKIKLQTVYVPVPIAGYDMTGKVSVPMVSLAGLVNQAFVSEACMMNTWRILDKQDNRIVITPQELRDIIAEAAERLIRHGENITIYMKSKGIEL